MICETSTFNSPDLSIDPYPLSSSLPPHLSIETEPGKKTESKRSSLISFRSVNRHQTLGLPQGLSLTIDFVGWIGTLFGIWFRTCAPIVEGSTKVHITVCVGVQWGVVRFVLIVFYATLVLVDLWFGWWICEIRLVWGFPGRKI